MNEKQAFQERLVRLLCEPLEVYWQKISEIRQIQVYYHGEGILVFQVRVYAWVGEECEEHGNCIQTTLGELKRLGCRQPEQRAIFMQEVVDGVKAKLHEDAKAAGFDTFSDAEREALLHGKFYDTAKPPERQHHEKG